MSDKKTCGCGHKHDGLECAGTEAAHENIVRQIDNGHWAVMGIFSDEGDPFHTFSVGLYENFDQPEIVIFGVHPLMAGRIINDIGERIARGASWKPAACTMTFSPATTAPFSFRLKSINMMPIWDQPCGITRATTFLSCNWYGRTPMASSPGKKDLIPTTPVRSRSLV